MAMRRSVPYRADSCPSNRDPVLCRRLRRGDLGVAAAGETQACSTPGDTAIDSPRTGVAA
jgi:hypothetical protein